MNIKAFQDQAPTTTGEYLRQARENMGLSQQSVAERLRLNVSTVQDIENDHVNPNLASTFLRGYIRSYARLVQISEEELIPMMAEQTPIKPLKVALMQSFSLGKTRKKRDSWLMGFTWFILFVMIGLTGTWWWQNHQDQQQDITNMVDQAFAKLLRGDDVASAVLSNGVDDIGQSKENQPVNANTDVPIAAPSSSSVSAVPIPYIAGQIAERTLSTSVPSTPTTSVSPGTAPADANSNVIVMNFTGDCWLEVFDAGGKKLFSGIQYNGARLNLTGQAPYKLNIGAPAAVQVQYQGRPVDLSRFIRSNQVARLTVTTQ